MTPVRLGTKRLVLRPRGAHDAEVMHQLWAERDPRVPPHRRLDGAGRPSVAELREALSVPSTGPLGLLTVVERLSGDAVGYAGLVPSERTPSGEPELAFELLASAQGRGYATEAGEAVVAWARSEGLQAIGATVWDWNVASRRVLSKLGFVETGECWPDPGRGTTLLTMLVLTRRDQASRVRS